MHAVPSSTRIDSTNAAQPIPRLEHTEKIQCSSKYVERKEFLSWSICCAVVSMLTGLLLYLKIGVTMEAVTQTLFYLSILGTTYFLLRFILLTRVAAKSGKPVRHGLN